MFDETPICTYLQDEHPAYEYSPENQITIGDDQ